MGKVSTNISFDKEFLNKLKNDANACVEIHTETYHLALHPFHLSDLNSSIKGILNEKIAKYDKKFGGILLGYQNIKLLDSKGSINFDSCFIHVNIQAEFYIFKPNIGQVLNGVVNKKSKDHVGCLVHQTFNVSLPKHEDSENWIGSAAGLGQEVQFEIIFTDLDGKLPYIRGKILSILSDDSGFSTSEELQAKHNQRNVIMKFDSSDDEISENPKKNRKRKQDSSTVIEGDDEKVCETPKKKKKHKHQDISTGNDEEISHKSRKKKRNISGDIEDGYEKEKQKQLETVLPCGIEDSETTEVVKKSKKKKKHKVARQDEMDISDRDVPLKSKKKKHKREETVNNSNNGGDMDESNIKSKKHSRLSSNEEIVDQTYCENNVKTHKKHKSKKGR